MLERLRHEEFAPLVGHKIKVKAGALATELEVTEVSVSGNPSPRAAPPFRVVLCSRENWRAEQGLFLIQHPELGELELFTVPIGPDERGMRYEIIFN